MKKALLTYILLLFAFAVNAQITNLDFENWHTDTTGNIKLDFWRHFSSGTDHSNAGQMLGTWRVTNSYSGTYALKISRWYASAYDEVRQAAPIAYKPSSLSGYYLYEDPNLVTRLSGGTPVKDTALVTIAITKWNTISNRKDTIGIGVGRLTEATSYTAFTIPISYLPSQTPDSVSIDILPTQVTSSNVPACHDGGACAYLTIDNLSLGGPSSVKPVVAESLQYYPNPVSDVLYINGINQMLAKGALQLTVTDMLGRIVLTQIINQPLNHIDVTQLNAGNYFIILKSNGNLIQVSKITKE